MARASSCPGIGRWSGSPASTWPGLNVDNTTEATALHFDVNADVPQSLPALTEIMTQGMKDIGHIDDFTTATMNIGGYDSLAIWWTQPQGQNGEPDHYLSVYVPAYGKVHQIVFHRAIVTADGKSLTPTGQAILDSFEFFVTK